MKVSKKLICQEAKEIKTFIDKTKKLPTYATINNSQFTPAQYTYLLSKQISKMSLQTISKITVKEASSPVGDTLKNVKIFKSDYIDMAQRVTKYIETNKQVPNYVTYKKLRVKFELYVYCFSKILTYFKENNTLPNYCLFNASDIQYTKTTTTSSNKSTTTSTSNSTKNTKSNTKKSVAKTIYTQSNLLTSQGCSGIGQCNNYYCACNSLQQMFYKLTNKKVSEHTIATWCGTTTKGTDHKGIETGVAKFNKTYSKNLKVTWKNFSDLGSTKDERFLALGKLMEKEDTALFCHLLYRNQYGHYEVPQKVDTKNKQLKILNSLGSKCNAPSFCGYIETRSYSDQAEYISGVSQKSICIITK